MKRFFALLVILCLIAGVSYAEFLPDSPATLTAVGVATVEEKVDYGVLRFEMEASAQTVLLAQEQMDGTLTALRSALNAQGVDDSEIHSADYDLHGEYEYQYTKFSEQRVLTGYAIRTAQQLHVSDADQAAAIIAAVNEAGVNCSYSLVFETRDDPSAYAAALEKAAKQAFENARVLAQASGLELEKLVSVEETENELQAVVRVTYTVK